MRNAGTNRGAMLFLMIGQEEVLPLHQVESRVDPSLELDISLLDADPVRRLVEHVVGHLRLGLVAAISASDVSSNMTASARPWLKARTAFVTLSTTSGSVSVKHRFIQRS